VDGRVRDTAAITIRNLVGPDLEPNEEETLAFGKWLVEKTDPFIEVFVEPAFQPRDRFIDRRVEKEKFMPSDDPNQAERRLWTVGQTLFKSGLCNVWLSLPGLGAIHIPTGQTRLTS
jgi:hypothetical protein